MDRLPRSKSNTLYAAYTKFEKQHGTKSSLESTVLGKRRIQYEDELAQDPKNYDVWFDYVRLEESSLRTAREEGEPDEDIDASIGRVREVYERAVAQVPPGDLKRHWRRYIFLWLHYALFEEIETKVYIPILLSLFYFSVLTLSKRTTPAPARYTVPLSTSYRINNSHLPSYGSCSLNLRYDS